ncbi:unnamed protein product [Clavelina lepadiformis]|uniref:mRNA cap guanine-N(7) methyltransferase n=1 Tax=Clavelina lepadiformis TaxID=159417 RepID=A0ABP0FS48_CLALP
MTSSISPGKHKVDGASEDEPNLKKPSVHSDLIASHYNRRGNTSCAERRNSKIFFMRNFNNWIKSVLIKKYVDNLREEEGTRHRPTVLDLGCGKGGDLLKWNKGNIQRMVCTDLAATSIDQCKERYSLLQKRNRNQIFDAEFIVSDSGKKLLCEKLSDREITFDITSSQFVVHYTFESEEQAEMMVRNACQGLRPGGYFIGTTVNDAVLINKARSSPDLKFGNDVFSVSFQSKEPFPDFGCKYIFKLHDVVDCPEFLLKKKVFTKICRKHGMRLVEWKTFSEFFYENSKFRENFRLINRMKALEVYPPHNDQLNSAASGDYEHAEKECRRIQCKYPDSRPQVATLSKTEWEAASIYVVFAFVKDDSDKTVEDDESDDDVFNEKIPLVIL